jgi:hypothetical protein
MPLSLSRPALWYVALLVIAAFQYLPVAMTASFGGEHLYWSLPPDLVAKAGWYHQGRDIILVVYGCLWPILVKRSNEIMSYSAWMIGVVVLGTVAYVLGNGYWPIYLAGVRWLVGLNAAFGIYLMVAHRGFSQAEFRVVVWTTIFVELVSCALTMLQLRAVGLGGFGTARLPGVFVTGGTSGYFAFSAALIASLAGGGRLPVASKLCYFLALLEAAASGTRFALIAIVPLLYIDTVRWLRGKGFFQSRSIETLLHVSVIPILLALSVGFAAMASGRGGVITDQASDMGRSASLSLAYDTIRQTGSFGKYMFGAGLGQGTNTAEIMLASGIQRPDWQILVDNMFVTTFLQFGIIGTLFVCFGFFGFVLSKVKYTSIIFFGLILIACVTQNLIEQIFILLSGAVYCGWHERAWKLARYAKVVPKSNPPGQRVVRSSPLSTAY